MSLSRDDISRLETEREALVLGVDSTEVSVLLSIEPEAEPEDIREAVRSTYEEARSRSRDEERDRSFGTTQLREEESRDDDVGHTGAALERAEEQLRIARDLLEEDSEGDR